jgi:hypothetical protein
MAPLRAASSSHYQREGEPVLKLVAEGTKGQWPSLSRIVAIPQGHREPWKSEEDWPSYNINDGMYAGLPRTLKKLYERHEAEIKSALRGVPYESPQAELFDSLPADDQERIVAMSDAKHSPSPWQYEYNPYTLQAAGSEGKELPAFQILDAEGNKILETNEDMPAKIQEDNARLATAAPKLLAALWAAMPFVEQWSEWVFACEDYGEKSDEIDRQLGRMQEIYAEATGQQSDAVRVTRAIEYLMQADWFSFSETDERIVRAEYSTVPDGFGPVVGDAWAGLERAQKEHALRHNVNWSGYSPDQIGTVIRTVIDGTPRERWFSGVGPPLLADASEAMAAPPDANPFGDPKPVPSVANILADPKSYLPPEPPGHGPEHGNGRKI